MYEGQVRTTVLEMMMKGATPNEIISALFRIYDTSEQMNAFIELLKNEVAFNDKFGSNEWKGIED